ncbi:MAG: phosphoribosylanthranilate isomerase [Planctomycetota bacterium]|jgi:phosphoribosylanthranilate isomerase
MVRVKICGITNLRDARNAVELGADALGFIFAPSSRRISPEKARRIVRSLGPFVNCVGVFVDEGVETVAETGRYCGFDTIQLHGNEPQKEVDGLREEFRVVKALRVRDGRDLALLKRYRADAFLFDTYEKGKMGGTGKSRPSMWAVARRAGESGIVPIILAGGMNPGNVRDAIETAMPFAVDVSSGVEIRPGKKDKRLIKEFIRAVKSAA